MSAYLDVVTIVVSRMESTKAFYTDLLGFGVVEQFTPPARDFVWLRSEKRSCSIALQDLATRADKPTQADIPEASGGLMLGFVVDDADEAYKMAHDGGYEIRTQVVDMGKGRTFGVKDPEGNFVQLFDVYPKFKDIQRRLGLD